MGVSVACYEFYLPHGSDNSSEPATHAQRLSEAKGRPLSLFLSRCFCHYNNVPISIHKQRYLFMRRPFKVSFTLIHIQSTCLLFLFFSCLFLQFFSNPPSTSSLLLAPPTGNPSSVQCPLVVLCSTLPTLLTGKLQCNACRTY